MDTKEQLLREYEELCRQERINEQKKAAYRRDNKIEFFTLPREVGGIPANPLQADLLEAWKDYRYETFTYSGANRIGKTTILSIIAFCVMFGRWPWSGERIPFPHSKPRKVRLIGQDWEKHIQTVLVPRLKEWWPKKRPVFTKKNNMGVEAFWRDEITKCTLEIMSDRQYADLHEGGDGDLIGYDEPPKREIYIANARGLVDREGRELLCMTLLKEAWVDHEIIKRVDEHGNPDMSVFNVSGDISVNVGYGISQKGVDSFAKKLSEDEKDARLKGIPSHMSGLVCPQFKRGLHVKQRFKIPLDWIVDVAIDTHPREKQAILFVATNPNNVRYACFEVWDHGDGKWIGQKIIEIVQRHHLRIGRIVCEPLAKGDRNEKNTTFDKIDRVLGQYGYVLDTASKDKDSGILEINEHLMGPNEEPSLFFFQDMRHTIKQLEGWMYDEDTQKAQKKDDHFPENLYRVLLLNTRYYPPEDDEDYDDDYYHQSTASSVTGY